MISRTCKHCGTEIVRHDGERKDHYDRRVTCGRHECRFHGRGQAYSKLDRAIIERWYPDGGALAVWYKGWPHQEGGKARQLPKINGLASRMGIRMAKVSDGVT
jgi:hypothetical protein